MPSRVAETIGLLKSLYVQQPDARLTVAELCRLANLQPGDDIAARGTDELKAGASVQVKQMKPA